MLNFTAMVPNVVKVGLIRCLLNTAKQVCSSEALFSREVHNLQKVFTANGYPKKCFDNAYDKFMTSLNQKNNEIEVDSEENIENERKYSFGIPYVGVVSREYKKKVVELLKNKLGVDVFVYFTSCKVGSFFSLKSKTPFNLRARVVYKFQCLSDSGTTYIGETKRHVVTRVNEHLAPKESNKSAIKDHILECNRCKNGQISVENFSVMKGCRNEYTCKISEALCIKKYKPVLNKQRHNMGQSYLLRVF